MKNKVGVGVVISDEQYAKLSAMMMKDETIIDVLDKLLKCYERHYLQSIKKEVQNGVVSKR